VQYEMITVTEIWYDLYITQI